ncbi:hypothetical protein CDAR_411461 [Caerostris darwini]|uniref:Secreted protein n=1 Tax=Caerostris darwini TaxID=1538125 RepID=A0AAV4SEZ9_9ARAC|nr:hypothetical protein CDAR_411461 [Caerostris darwini]
MFVFFSSAISSAAVQKSNTIETAHLAGEERQTKKFASTPRLVARDAKRYLHTFGETIVCLEIAARTARLHSEWCATKSKHFPFFPFSRVDGFSLQTTPTPFQP